MAFMVGVFARCRSVWGAQLAQCRALCMTHVQRHVVGGSLSRFARFIVVMKHTPWSTYIHMYTDICLGTPPPHTHRKIIMPSPHLSNQFRVGPLNLMDRCLVRCCRQCRYATHVHLGKYQYQRWSHTRFHEMYNADKFKQNVCVMQ